MIQIQEEGAETHLSMRTVSAIVWGEHEGRGSLCVTTFGKIQSDAKLLIESLRKWTKAMEQNKHTNFNRIKLSFKLTKRKKKQLTLHSFFIYIIFISNFILLYNTVLVLPYIDMNPPQVYMSSQSWTPLPPPTPYHLSGSSPCTSPKYPVSCILYRT